MDTSRSTEWAAEAALFSGRPNPIWIIPSTVVTELLDSWAGLPLHYGPTPEPPTLGPRGYVLRAPDGRVWHAYAGVVTLDDGHYREARDDPGHQFERVLITSAPDGTVPPLPSG
jgi:hypothetical protein